MVGSIVHDGAVRRAAPPGHVRGFDKASGELLGHVELPDNPNANPITFLHEGTQYLAVAVGGGPFFGGYSEDAAEIDPDLASALRALGGGGTTPELVVLRLGE
ncbi:MAG TPA: hypothetical protein VMT85_14470 [Thermoanaerobaculia bacterium]|nr:hypothetical protein [Thermoanaerobaculia bacterium]